jgi:nitroreductase
MDVRDAINARRAYRSLEKTPMTPELVEDLARSASLAPSCFNNQPWRFVFVLDQAMLEAMKPVFSKGNEWCHQDSMIAVVCARKDDDCIIHDREYYLFDTGMAVAFLILRATELGLVAHPIAGYSPRKTREILGIPEEYQVIALVNIGKKSNEINPVLSEKQVQEEAQRPVRKPLEEFAFIDRWGSR